MNVTLSQLVISYAGTKPMYIRTKVHQTSTDDKVWDNNANNKHSERVNSAAKSGGDRITLNPHTKPPSSLHPHDRTKAPRNARNY